MYILVESDDPTLKNFIESNYILVDGRDASKADLIIADITKIKSIKTFNLPIILIAEAPDVKIPKGIEPVAQLIKPIDWQELKYAIKLGIYKDKVEMLLPGFREYQRIFDTSLEGVCIFDNSGKIIYSNRQLGKFLEYPPAEIIGKNILELIHPTDKNIGKRILESCERKMAGKHEIRFIKSTGEISFLIFSGTPIVDDTYKGAFCMLTNITEHKMLEENLRRANKFLKILDEINRTIIKNQSIEEIMASTCKILAKNRAYEYIGVLDQDHRIIHEKGERPANLKGSMGEDTTILEIQVENRPWGFLCIKGEMEADELIILEDIASTLSFAIEKRLSEDKLRENELKYRKLFESAGDAIIVLEGHTIIDCNKKTLKLFNAKREDIIGKSPWELSPEYQENGERSGEKAKRLIEETLRMGGGQFRWVHEKKTGEPFYAHVSLTSIGRGQIIAILHDITDIIETEDFLDAERRKFRDLIDSLPDAVFAVDEKGRIIAWNKETEEMTGTPAEEMLGRGGHAYGIPFYGKPRPVLLDLLFEDLPEIEKLYKNLRREDDNIYGEVYLPNIYNGRGGYLQLKVSPLYDDKGEIIGAIEIIRDITPLKVTEKRLREELTVTTSLTRLYPEMVSPEATKENIANRLLDELLKATGSMGGFITYHGNMLASQGKLTGDKDKILSTPIVTGDQKIGYISLEKDEFSEFDIKTVKRFAEYYGLAIQRLEYDEKLRRHQRRLKILNKLIKASRTDDLHKFLKNVIDIILDDLKFKAGIITLHGETLYKRGRIIPAEEIPDDIIIRRKGKKTILKIPLKAHEETIGMIEAQYHGISPREDFMRLFAAEIRDAVSRIIMQTEIKKSLHEKEVLLKEVHHRVKNNLQIIASLLSLQSKYCENEEVKNILADSQARIRSLALLHEKLYKTETLAYINSKEYLESLARDLINFQVPKPLMIRLETDIDDIALEMDKCIPLGLITNELVRNSIKHAFTEKGGVISIKFKHQDNSCYFEISDNGRGLPEDFDVEKLSSLGLQLVLNLIRQLDGELEIESGDGTSFKIRFPI